MKSRHAKKCLIWKGNAGVWVFCAPFAGPQRSPMIMGYYKSWHEAMQAMNAYLEQAS